jgi:hypothetical protein
MALPSGTTEKYELQLLALQEKEATFELG